GTASCPRSLGVAAPSRARHQPLSPSTPLARARTVPPPTARGQRATTRWPAPLCEWRSSVDRPSETRSLVSLPPAAATTTRQEPVRVTATGEPRAAGAPPHARPARRAARPIALPPRTRERRRGRVPDARPHLASGQGGARGPCHSRGPYSPTTRNGRLQTTPRSGRQSPSVPSGSPLDQERRRKGSRNP